MFSIQIASTGPSNTTHFLSEVGLEAANLLGVLDVGWTSIEPTASRKGGGGGEEVKQA